MVRVTHAQCVLLVTYSAVKQMPGIGSILQNAH